MLGMVRYGRGRGELLTLGGTVFFAVFVSRGGSFCSRLSAYCAALQLKRRGIRRAVFPLDYPRIDAFTARGILPPSPLPLQLGTAATIARAALRDCPARRIIFVGEHVTAAVRHTICSLRQDTRYFALNFAGGGETLREELQRLYGLALETNIAAEQCHRDDLVLLFSPRQDWENILCRSVDLYRDDLAVEYCLSEKFRVEEVDQKQLAAALYDVGALSREDLQVLHIACGTEDIKPTL